MEEQTLLKTAGYSSKFVLVASDLDGTLLNGAHEVSSETRLVLQRLVKERPGVKIALCSGRSTASMAHIVRSLELDVDVAIVGFK
jgi:HAD superfamily hydrolase (TIGR01484 family)